MPLLHANTEHAIINTKAMEFTLLARITLENKSGKYLLMVLFLVVFF